MLPKLDSRFPSLRKKILDPFTYNINPNHVSVIGLLTALLAGIMFYRQLYFPAAGLVVMSGFLDILDGHIARTFGPTKQGDLLDHTFDRLADVMIFTGAAFSPAVNTAFGMMAVVGFLLVSYLGTQAHALTGERLYSGVFGRSDRMALITIAAALTVIRPDAVALGVYAVGALSGVTFIQRFSEIWKRLSEGEE